MMNKMCEYKGYTFYYDMDKKEYLIVTPNKRVTYNWTMVNKKVYNYFKQIVPKNDRKKTKRYLKRVTSYYGYVVYLDMNDTDFMLVVRSNKIPTTDLVNVPSWIVDSLLWYKENYKGKPFNDVV